MKVQCLLQWGGKKWGKEESRWSQDSPLSHVINQARWESALRRDTHTFFSENQRQGDVSAIVEGYRVTQSQQGRSRQITPVCNLYPAVCRRETETIPPLSSYLKSSKMVWCCFFFAFELTMTSIPTLPKFVCCPNCMRCGDARSARLPWAHSLNWIVRLASFLTASPGVDVQYRKPCDAHAHTHTHHSQCLKPGSPSPWFGFWWLVGNFLVNVSLSFPSSAAKRKWRDDLSALLHSSLPEKTNRNILWPACWPAGQRQQQPATSGVYFRMSYLNWHNSAALLTHTTQFPYRDLNIL